MKKYVLDTNVLIVGARDAIVGAEVDAFSDRRLPGLYLHAVVAQEILAGATDAGHRRSVKRKFIQPYERRGRLVTPSFDAWKRAGGVIAELVRRRTISPGGYAKSFVNDCILACSCAESGVTIITHNTRDFAILQQIVPVNVTEPWPS